MTKTIAIAPVTKSVTVAAPQEKAFEVFTAGVDRWWPKEHHIGNAPVKQEIMEPRKGGKWRTLHIDGSETVNGTVLVWEPPKRIVFSWEINGQWRPEPNIAVCSEVEVRFIADGATRTRVELEHRNFEKMQAGGEAMRNEVGKEGGWPGILDLYRKAAES
jgi:uncharacterized protein YndB with AHSA1/START domain